MWREEAMKFCGPGQVGTDTKSISLYLPVSARGRTLIGEIWRQTLDWDDEVPEDSGKTWIALTKDLTGLHLISFSRRVQNENKPIRLFLFLMPPKLHSALQHMLCKMGSLHRCLLKAR